MGCCLSSNPSPEPASNSSSFPPLDQDKARIIIKSEQFIHQSEGRLESSYDLERVLGSGAYGRVYEARHKATGAKRAVKVIERYRLPESQVSQMLSEVFLLKSLVTLTQDHPNIIKVYEVITDTDHINIVSELCTGGELFNKITQLRKFNEKMASTYMQQILSAVTYCHEHQIVHRDLKPENLLLETPAPNALLKIIDFGTSSKLDPNSNLKLVTGTPYYIAPEVLSKEYNEKCDIWSCGVILFILLSGAPPFSGRKDREILAKVKAGQYDFSRTSNTGPEWKNVSSSAKDIITQMLTLDASRRPTARQLLQHPWLKQSERIGVADKGAELDIMNHLKAFRSSDKLRQATLQYIASQLTSVEETEKLRRKFIEMDDNKDGRLSREELMKGYKLLGLSSTVDVDKIMQDCDSDGSGFIDYTEFVTAAINWQKSLNEQNVEAAFAAFDEDHSGCIDLNELKKIFGAQDDQDDAVWEGIMKEVDKDGSGTIDLDEFKQMMMKELAD